MDMFGFLRGKKVKDLESETKKSFSSVKNDINAVGKWIKHLDEQDKQLFDLINMLKADLSTVREELASVREGLDLATLDSQDKQLFKKLPVLDKQTGVEGVQKAVQTAVQTGNFYDILKDMSSNERLLVMTLLNNDMKLSYEDLALLVGKEKSTVRGQVNSIKQKCDWLIEEIVEKSGKKRVFIPDEIKQKFNKYAKVRTKGKGKK